MRSEVAENVLLWSADVSFRKSLGLGWFLFLFIDCGSLGNFILNFPTRVKSAEIKKLLFCVHESFSIAS